MNVWQRACALGGFVLGMSGSGWHAHAQASEPETVLLQVPDCFEVLAADVQQLVALELAPRLRVISDPSAAHAITASVRCEPGAPVELRVEDTKRAAPLRSHVDLARTPAPARTRLLALALSELIATTRLERPESAQTTTATEQTAGSAEGSAVARDGEGKGKGDSKAESESESESDSDSDSDSDSEVTRVGRLPLRVWLASGISRAFDPATMTFGVDGGVSRRIYAFVLSAELSGRWGSASLSQADVSLRTFSGALAIGPSLDAGRFSLHAGPGVRAGYVRLSAQARSADEDGDTLEGAWFGPIAIAAAELAVLDGGMLRLAIEGGYAARAVAGHDSARNDLMALRGAWFSTALGFALGLP